MKRVMKVVTVIMVLIGGVIPLRGEEVTFKATVDRTRIEMGEVMTLTVTVSSGSAKVPKPSLPPMNDFSIVSRGSSRSFSFVNGKMRTSVSYTYALTPKGKGTFTIGACEIVLKGKTYRTAPIEVTVTGESKDKSASGKKAGAKGGDDIFIETFVDKERVFAGEQIVLTFKLYSDVMISGNPQYIPPSTDDFWRENLGEEKQTTEIINGREYQVNELNYALFPLTNGEKRIGEAQLIAVVEKAYTDPFNFGISTGSRVQLKTDPIAIHVMPLPDIPDGFSGGVGDFEISAKLESDTVEENEPLTVVTTVHGNGNIREIKLPEIDMPGFRVYHSGSSVSIEELDGVLKGTKTFKTILIPTKSGEFKIPERSFIFFNPRMRAYVRKNTEALPFTVTPGEGGEMSERVFSPLALEKIGEDIHFIKTGGAMRDHRGLGPIRYLFVLNAMLLCAFIGIAISFELKERIKENEDVIRKRSALRCAMRTIKRSKREARTGDIAEAYELFHRGMLQFFADKCDTSVWGITEDEIMDTLRSRGESEKNITALKDIFHASNRARYSTAETDLRAFTEHAEKGVRLLRAIRTL